MRTLIAALLLSIGGLVAATYVDQVERWRRERVATLKADDGWLTLAGLIWLHPGVNTVGSAPGSAVLLSRGPAHVGAIDYRDGKATFRAQPGVPVLVNGKAATSAVLASDADGHAKPDVVRIEDFSFFVIRRGVRDAIRLKDNQSQYRKNFTGLHWFPVREEYRVSAKWVPYDAPKLMDVPNILGEIEKDPSPGYAEFTLNGKALRLDPVLEDDRLFFIFRDLTTGKETYPSGRFLYADLPKAGRVELDFNKSYTPPCAFTPYATCPLPPKQNRMPIRVEAGELNYGHR